MFRRSRAPFILNAPYDREVPGRNIGTSRESKRASAQAHDKSQTIRRTVRDRSRGRRALGRLSRWSARRSAARPALRRNRQRHQAGKLVSEFIPDGALRRGGSRNGDEVVCIRGEVGKTEHVTRDTLERERAGSARSSDRSTLALRMLGIGAGSSPRRAPLLRPASETIRDGELVADELRTGFETEDRNRLS